MRPHDGTKGWVRPAAAPARNAIGPISPLLAPPSLRLQPAHNVKRAPLAILEDLSAVGRKKRHRGDRQIQMQTQTI